MNKIFIVMFVNETVPDEIHKIFKTYETAEEYVKNQCGEWGSNQYDKPKFITNRKNYVEYFFNGYKIREYNVED